MYRYDAYDPWAHAEQLGLNVRRGTPSRPDHDGELYLDQRLVILRPGMTRRKERFTLTHENYHAIRGDRPIPEGMLLRKRELKVDRLAAERLIDPQRLQRLMIEHPDPGHWCLELNITARALRVYLQYHPEVRLQAEAQTDLCLGGERAVIEYDGAR